MSGLEVWEPQAQACAGSRARHRRGDGQERRWARVETAIEKPTGWHGEASEEGRAACWHVQTGRLLRWPLVVRVVQKDLGGRGLPFAPERAAGAHLSTPLYLSHLPGAAGETRYQS